MIGQVLSDEPAGLVVDLGTGSKLEVVRLGSLRNGTGRMTGSPASPSRHDGC